LIRKSVQIFTNKPFFKEQKKTSFPAAIVAKKSAKLKKTIEKKGRQGRQIIVDVGLPYGAYGYPLDYGYGGAIIVDGGYYGYDYGVY
jgi:hypothetical protein